MIAMILRRKYRAGRKSKSGEPQDLPGNNPQAGRSLAVVAMVISAIALVTSIGIGAYCFQMAGSMMKVGFVDSSLLMASFTESHRVETEMRNSSQKWKSDQKAMQDSLDAFVNRMSAAYGKADAKGKRSWQDELSARNQEIANFVRANEMKQAKVRQEKMQGVYAKINAFMKEFGSKYHYDMVFGTVQGGNILYGSDTRCDVTQQIIEGLNKRYP